MTRNWISWFVILLITIGLPILGAMRGAAKPTTQPATQPTDNAVDFQTLLMGRYVVGAAHAAPQTKESLLPTVEALDKVPGQRVSVAVLAGELLGPAAAVERLKAIEADGDIDAAAFRERYENATPLPPSVADRYGFIADVAESNGASDADPRRAAVLAVGQRTFLAFLGAGLAAIGVGIVAFGLFVTAIVLISLGKVRPNIAPPESREGSLYVQGFAIYLGVFVVGSLGIVLFARTHPGVVPDLAMFLPIVVGFVLGVMWPMLRGARWPRVREDWGLHTGRNFILEPLLGMAGYLAGLPLVAAGFGMMFLLQKMSGAKVTPPIDPSELVAHPLQLMLLAVVWAPITEELMFRGLFLSHLRQRFNPWIAAVMSGVVFAAIHPQGWAAIPLLGSIGFVLAMVRQWQRSITASMAAHALNNGAITAFLLLAAA